MGLILLIEDDGATRRDLCDKLIAKFNCKIEKAYNYSSAIGLWNEYKHSYDCMILDLHIDPTGLATLKYNKYYPLVGVAFFDDICDGEKIEDKMNIWKKTIIYSGYIHELINREREFGWQHKPLKLIPKNTLGIKKVSECVTQILNKLPK